MSNIKPVRIMQFEGGLNLGEKSIIPDNALTVATNVFYNADKKLQTRRGKTNFGNPIPDLAKTLHNCDSVSLNGTWTASEDATTLTADATQKKRGTAGLKFNVVVATTGNDYAILTNSTLTAVDISTTKGGVGFWVYTPAGGKTDLTDLRLKVGSDSSNYYEFTVATTELTESSWVYIYKAFSASTTTGTPVDTAIDYLQFIVNYNGSYTDKTGWGLDDIVAYSATGNRATMSLKYFKSNEQTPKRYLTANSGTSLFEYDESSQRWNLLKSGLTEGTRFGFTAYKNIMYYTNGVDNYFSYNGTTCTEHTGANTYKGKYLLLANDVGYILGDPTVPSTLAWTNAVPSNLQTFPNALVLDEDDSSGKGTGLINLGPVIIAFKNKKIYKVITASSSREQLDYSEGGVGNRGILRVENEVFYMNKAGVYTLAQREATTGSLRADPLSEAIMALIDQISGTSLENIAGFYNAKLNNVYYFVDTNNDGINDTTLVFSTLVKKWTKYTGFNANEAVIWEDSSGVEHFLIANALSGQVEEIEFGSNDRGNTINHEIESKNFDFDIPETLKTFQMVEFFGFVTEEAIAELGAVIDDVEEIPTAQLIGANYVVEGAGVEYALGLQSLGTSALGGGAVEGETQTFYPFKLRIPMYSTGSKIRLTVKMQSLDGGLIWTKASIYPLAQPLDVYEYNLIA